MTSYTADFYQMHRDGARSSAETIVPIVIDLVQPRSVIDVGCGLGAWLAVFRDQGVEDVWGMDGPHVDARLLEIAPERFLPTDLRRPVRLPRRFDLVVSIEVAEHLPPDCATAFVESLTALGPVVLFSAAIPHQGGVEHLNEQWPEYWAERFGKRGYVAIDCIRPRVWRDERVEWWYAQNALLYAERERVERDAQLGAAREATALQPLSVVHPRKYLRLIDLLHLVREIRRDLAVVVPPGARLIFVDDDDQIRDHVCPEALPFLEHAGQYWGSPEDDATALRELDRLRCGGATFIASVSLPSGGSATIESFTGNCGHGSRVVSRTNASSCSTFALEPAGRHEPRERDRRGSDRLAVARAFTADGAEGRSV
jgi:SAM-dependent methyltransferase